MDSGRKYKLNLHIWNKNNYVIDVATIRWKKGIKIVV